MKKQNINKILNKHPPQGVEEFVREEKDVDWRYNLNNTSLYSRDTETKHL